MAIVNPHPRSFLYVILMRRPRRAARLGEPVMRHFRWLLRADYARRFDVVSATHPIVPIPRRSCIRNHIAQRAIASVHGGRTTKGNPNLGYSAPTKILYAEAGVVNFDMKHHRVELAPVAMVHTV